MLAVVRQKGSALNALHGAPLRRVMADLLRVLRADADQHFSNVDAAGEMGLGDLPGVARLGGWLCRVVRSAGRIRARAAESAGSADPDTDRRNRPLHRRYVLLSSPHSGQDEIPKSSALTAWAITNIHPIPVGRANASF
jgi:hypothetical protein